MNAVTTRPNETPQRVENRRTVQPNTDVLSTKEGLQFRIDLPGVAEQDIDVQLEKHMLTIRATRQAPNTENYRPWAVETGYYDYECAFRLGFQADPKKIEARCKYGVLTLTVPRAESDQPKKIAVRAE